MKIQMWIYQTKNTPVKGFCIQEHKTSVATFPIVVPQLTPKYKTNYSIWCDPNEGRYAYDSEWDSCESNVDYPNYPTGGFETYDESIKWIFDNYGELVDMDINED